MMSVSPSSRLQTSGRRGSRTLITRRWHALAVRPGKPYPAAFRKPKIESGPEGNRTLPPTLQKSVASLEHASPFVDTQRSVRELNPVFVHATDACRRNTYRPCRFSDHGWNRTIGLLLVTQAS